MLERLKWLKKWHNAAYFSDRNWQPVRFAWVCVFVGVCLSAFVFAVMSLFIIIEPAYVIKKNYIRLLWVWNHVLNVFFFHVSVCVCVCSFMRKTDLH